MRRKRVKAEAQPRRRDILQAALAAFEEPGYEAATIEDIRRRAGASIGSIYHHFGSKAGIASALYRDGLADYQAGLLAHMSRARSARSLVQTAVRYHLDWATAHPAWARYLLHMRRVEPVAAIEIQLREMNTTLVRQVLDLLHPYIDRGEIQRLPAEILLSLLLGPAQEFVRLWLSGRAGLTPQQARRLLADAAWKSVGCP